jgi:hypothetical protein
MERRKRNNRSARAAGTRHAQSIAAYLAAWLDNDQIERRDKNGNKDRGDITGVKFSGQRVVIEAKDYGGQFKVGPWLVQAETERLNDDAGVTMVVAKRIKYGQPGDQVVLMTVRDLVSLMMGYRPDDSGDDDGL